MRRLGKAADSWEIISVAKPEWGAKHTCQGCGAKFYDMGRSPITCPACDEAVVVATPGRTRRVRKEEVKAEAPAPVAPVKKEESSDDEDALVNEVDDLVDDDDDEEDDDAIATLADDNDEDDDDVLAEADIDKSKLTDE